MLPQRVPMGIFRWCAGAASNILEGARTSQGIFNLPQIHFDFIDSDVLNAIAFEDSGYAFIGITRGLVERLFTGFGHLLGDGVILRKLGLDIESLPESGYLEEYASRPDAAHVVISGQSGPALEARHECATALTQNALLFLLNHELAHIINGHTLLRPTQWNSVFLEIDGSSTSPMPPLLKQALEMDADSAALSQSALTLCADMEERWDGSFVRKKINASVDVALFVWAYTIYSLFRFIAGSSPRSNSPEALSHPPPGMRQIYCLSRLGDLLEESQLNPDSSMGPSAGEMLRWLKNSGATTIGAAEKSFGQLNGSLDIRAISWAVTPKAQAHLNRLHQAWTAVYPDLVPLTRKELVKPQPAALVETGASWTFPGGKGQRQARR